MRSALNGRTGRIAAALVALLALAVLTSAALVSAQSNRPAAVTNFQASAGGDGEINVSWDAHPQTVKDYRVTWAKTGEGFKKWNVSGYNAYPHGHRPHHHRARLRRELQTEGQGQVRPGQVLPLVQHPDRQRRRSGARTHANCDGNCDAGPHGHPGAYGDSHTDAYPDGHASPNSHTRTHGHASAHCDPSDGAGAGQGTGRRPGTGRQPRDRHLDRRRTGRVLPGRTGTQPGNLRRPHRVGPGQRHLPPGLQTSNTNTSYRYPGQGQERRRIRRLVQVDPDNHPEGAGNPGGAHRC